MIKKNSMDVVKEMLAAKLKAEVSKRNLLKPEQEEKFLKSNTEDLIKHFISQFEELFNEASKDIPLEPEIYFQTLYNNVKKILEFLPKAKEYNFDTDRCFPMYWDTFFASEVLTPRSKKIAMSSFLEIQEDYRKRGYEELRKEFIINLDNLEKNKDKIIDSIKKQGLCEEAMNSLVNDFVSLIYEEELDLN